MSSSNTPVMNYFNHWLTRTLQIIFQMVVSIFLVPVATLVLSYEALFPCKRELLIQCGTCSGRSLWSPGSEFLQRGFCSLPVSWKSIWWLTVLRILRKEGQVKSSNFPCYNFCVKEFICTGEDRSWESSITWI